MIKLDLSQFINKYIHQIYINIFWHNIYVLILTFSLLISLLKIFQNDFY